MTGLFLSALMLGLAGSFHCLGMCGPIVVALPLHGNTLPQKIYGGVLYNLGRTVTYTVMGAIFGLVGQGLQLVGFQQVVSVIMGLLMVISVLFPALFRNQYDLTRSSFRIVGRLKTTISQMFSVRSFQSLFIIGLLNGLLPCGLVYIARLGTLPLLLALGVAGNVVSTAVRHKINKLIPILVVIVGILFILRGLNLGIPYLSPTRDKIEKKFEKSLEEKELSHLAPLNLSDHLHQDTFKFSHLI